MDPAADMSAAVVVALVVSVGSLLVAAYAAKQSRDANTQSARALDWQQQRDLERSTPNLRLEIEHGAEQERIDVGRVVGGGFERYPVTGEKLEYRLRVSVVNAGQTVEYLKSLWIQTADRTHGVDLTESLPEPDPKLTPGARVTVDPDSAAVPRGDEGFVVIARTVSGHEVESPVEHLDRELEAYIARINAAVGT